MTDVLTVDDVVAEEAALKTRARVLLGDAYLKRNEIWDALGCYTEAGDIANIIACGDKFIEWGDIEHAETCYDRAHAEIPHHKKIAAGLAAFKHGSLVAAVKAFTSAASSPHLVLCAQKYVERGDLKEVKKLYALATMPLDAGVIRACADANLAKGSRWIALEAYIEIDATDQILVCGNMYLSEGNYEAGKKAYDAVKMQIPMDRLVACADKMLQTGYAQLAIPLYTSVGCLEGLEKCVKHSLSNGWLASATAACDALGRKLTTEEVQACLSMCLQKQWKEKAHEACLLLAQMELEQSVH